MLKRKTVVGVAALAAGTAALALLPAVPGASAASGPIVAGSVLPNLDPFYTAPANIGSLAPGQVVQSRPVSLSPAGFTLDVKAWQISYRTNDSHNNPILTVTTLVVPTTAWTGKGPRPVVSTEVAEDSAGLQCSPSYTLANGSNVLDVALNSALMQKGWAVALPDFEGPKSLFLAGPLHGHAVLDGIRAVKNFNQAGIGASNPWALSGYSGGANAAGWAAQLQPSYAPDVTLVGSAIGGTPADPAAVATSIDGGIFAGFEFGAAYGIAVDFPEAGIMNILNAQGKADFATLNGLCEADILTKFAFKKLNDDSTVPNPLTYPPVAAALKADTLGATAPSRSNVIYDYHANTDEIVPVAQADTLVKTWCAKGAVVTTHRDWIGEHSIEEAVQQSDMITFLTNRFAGTKPTNNC